ncbi:hypothetical protein H696_00551 [Fonticula alba]|uniref:Uncharacterized protein n=1 Tax=Fonticula alba TaxID=691883 RepID=A0A058ZGC7_FONAL|nr:hypothetical protein H696_00551 [Fonticula alba]KCV73001.1 hypothetical protein H696_00551 [Fonticula alba]|eukprot:XP_009492702.1 hypothetical protein H696_00551 [Fonticula alba]
MRHPTSIVSRLLVALLLLLSPLLMGLAVAERATGVPHQQANAILGTGTMAPLGGPATGKKAAIRGIQKYCQCGCPDLSSRVVEIGHCSECTVADLCETVCKPPGGSSSSSVPSAPSSAGGFGSAPLEANDSCNSTTAKCFTRDSHFTRAVIFLFIVLAAILIAYALLREVIDFGVALFKKATKPQRNRRD